MTTTTGTIECSDFLEFQNTIRQMRLIDDKIIYLLNTIIPTESFKSQVDPHHTCKDLFQQIEQGRSQRETLINTCLSASSNAVKQLKHQRDMEENNLTLVKNLRKEQNKLRLLESELNIEEIIKQRTDQVYHEKCRSFYKPNK